MKILKIREKFKSVAVHALKLAVGLGFLSVAITTTYDFIVGDVSLTFIKPVGRYYGFELENESPSDQLIESFTVVFPEGQPLVARTTREIYAKKSTNGGETLPGGNEGWIPTVEFTELDGQVIGAKKTKKFRLPPASSIDYLELQAAIFDVSYVVRPINVFLAHLDTVLKWGGLRNKETKIRYTMVNNYWVPTKSTSMTEALRLACRDDRSLGIGYQCPAE